MFSYIAPGAKQYRANLHSHTNLSDGTLTPEQMVQAYQEKGYSILAITDHEAPYDHTALSTADFQPQFTAGAEPLPPMAPK